MQILSTQIPAQPVAAIVVGLAIITLMVLFLPFKVRVVERNLELFFAVMGIISVTVSGLWSKELALDAVKAPVMIGGLPVGIFQVVLLFGILLFYFNRQFCRLVSYLENRLSLRFFIFLVIALLGFLSGIVSVIITAVLLSEIVAALKLDRQNQIRLAVVSCFAIGLGAVLTPLGEPLSTILVQKLAGAPFYAGFGFPLKLFSVYVVPGVIAIAVFGAIWITGKPADVEGEKEVVRPEGLRNVIFRAVRVYAFVAALVLLGEGLKPLIIWYVVRIPAFGLYWINILSAVLDNATLTAVEITTTMSIAQITSVIMSLLVAGGMLIPGNIPNIVAAGRLKISMKEWAKIGIPVGLILMAVYFLALLPIIF